MVGPFDVESRVTKLLIAATDAILLPNQPTNAKRGPRIGNSTKMVPIPAEDCNSQTAMRQTKLMGCGASGL
jgi:hypothetical protein